MAAGSYQVSSKRDLCVSRKERESHRYKNGYHDHQASTNRSFYDAKVVGRGTSSRRWRDGFDGRWGSTDAVGDKGTIKKRKVSPIASDRDAKEVRISSKNRVVPRSSPFLPLSAPISVNQLPDIILDGQIGGCLVGATQIGGLQISPAEPGSTVTTDACSDFIASSTSEVCRSIDRVVDKLEESFQSEEPNISTSKWASLQISSEGNISSPEGGEFLREGSEDESEKAGSSASGHYPPAYGLANDDDDVMETDDKCCDVARISELESEDEDDGICGIQAPAVPKYRRINMLHGCRSVFEYEKLNKINEGTYGVVYRAKDKNTGDIVALKRVKMAEDTEGFPVSSLREINLLMSLNHPSIVEVREVVMDANLDGVYMVMEYMEHDLKGLMANMKHRLSQGEVKYLMLQLLQGVKFLHDNWVLHRDLKASNLLLNNDGELKICDFGLSRQYGSPLKPYTPLVVTLWYRAPELLLGAKQYSTAIDMWSVGCIMAEMLTQVPLFDGKNEIEQLHKIFKTLGTPDEMAWPGLSNLPGGKVTFAKQPNQLRSKFPSYVSYGSPIITEKGFDLLSKLLTYDPAKRMTAEDALNHDWFHKDSVPMSRPTFSC
ncbi:hypothetical protein RJ639_026925 [Escallonia herrerae]|uniref:cyclin-dependent kinase n=1 Tax=Escallonia herrerae TaxID=1293975 RepID=A0AA89BEF0_9ASTE|nr:hypothetical protein RJ639_026925 [Escallonia herrerae]